MTTLIFNAACMSSSVPIHPNGLLSLSASNLKSRYNEPQQQEQFYHHNSSTTSIHQTSSASTPATIPKAQPTTERTPSNERLQQAHMPHDGGERPLVHSSSLLAQYDGHISGMSSDSELTTSGTTRHHHYHHRPYSSRARVYHAHPVPRSSPASSRLSHYSDSAAGPGGIGVANVHSTPITGTNLPYMFQHHHQQQQQQPMNIMTSATNHPIGVGHQGSISSSGSASSSSYLGGVMGSDLPVSPIAQQQQQILRPKTGRQLPQRPFKQSMSIDPNPHGSSSLHHQYHQQPASSPSHQLSLGSNRNLVEQTTDPTLYQQQQQQNFAIHQANQRYNHPNQFMSSPSSSGHTRNLRHEMDLMEKQAANLNLYDSTTTTSVPPPLNTNENPAARLPPSGSNRPLSSSSVRQLPAISPQGQGLIGSMSLDQQHHRQPSHQSPDPYQQRPIQQRQDPYSAPNQYAAASTDWIPPINMSNQHPMPRASNQFKQTMSIDQYPVRAGYQQHHYSPVQGSSGNYIGEQNFHHGGGHHYSSGSQSALGFDSPLDQHAYYSTEEQSSGPSQDAYNPSHKQQQQQRQSISSDYPMHGRTSASGAHSSQNKTNKPTLNHQVSSSSSNSNQSFSQKSANNVVDNNLFDKHSSEHQKSHGNQVNSNNNPPAHYQYSPQHKTVNRPDMLRRGYTSVAMTSGPDLSGSQTALSESGGDLSLTQASTSHSGQISSLPGRRLGLRAASPSITNEPGTSSGQHQQHHSTTSSHGGPGLRSESSTGLPNGSHENSTLTKKSNSATQLSMSGTKKRLGFRKKQVTSFSVHRSEEVAPLEARHLVKQGSSVSEGDSSVSGDSSSRSWSNSNFKQQNSEELASMSFIDGLGKGQMISRQGLASPYLGDIQLSLCDRRGNLEVEIIRARNLQAKTTKVLPLTYVKLYLVKNRKCLAKAKTTLSNKRTLNPLFQQQLTFHEDYHGCILQSIVWGNFGKMDKKNFMGIAQISIDDLELSDTVISWYKLFLPSSLQTLPSKSLRHTLLSNSTESFTNTSNS